MSEAAKLGAEYRENRRLRPAQCVPVVLKDNIQTANLTTTNGSRAFANWIPAKDATVVQKLRDAGAIILAKSNLDDFAAAVYGVCSIAGPMHNPYALDRTVGGSSGGSAAAVSVGYAPLALGTDTGGSLRIPAAFNSVVTIRPTMGLVSRSGIFPRSLTQDTAGPIARTVADAAVGLDLMAGYDATDPMTARGVGMIPKGGYAAYARGGKLNGVRIGVVRTGLALFGKDDPGVSALLDRAVADLRKQGATVVEVPAPARNILGAPSVITYESKRDVNAYLSAAGPNVPVTSFDQLYASGQFTPYAKQAFDREALIDPSTLGTNIDYQRALASRTALQDETYRLMAQYGVDTMMYASATKPPAAIGVEQGGVFTRWSENTGFPAISVPMGLTGSPALPAGVEFLGRPFAEKQLLQVASSYEQATQRREAPPTTP
jgi:Asp-tRNA(Asn)/Glu-tRNA(Gln) amidotransferase A subunit family amidase